LCASLLLSICPLLIYAQPRAAAGFELEPSEDEDADLQLAIQLSLTAQRESAAAKAPAPQAQVAQPAPAPQAQVAQAPPAQAQVAQPAPQAQAPAAEPTAVELDDDEWEICGICQTACPIEEMSRVSFCCMHRYCTDCLLSCFQYRAKPIVECPGCHACHNETAFTVSFVPGAAVGLIDPHFVSHITGMPKQLEGGVQLKPFLRMGVDLGNGPIPSCPRCSCIIPSGTNAQRPQILRCWRPDCALVFCRDCCKPWHDGKPCDIDPKVLEDKEYVRKNSKPCPRCSVPVVHAHDHGCHRMHCPSCSYLYCYLCSAPVLEGEDETDERSTCRCPLFCQADCSCPPCAECKVGQPCSNCDGSCKVCRPNLI
jgi:hypothetical protein